MPTLRTARVLMLEEVHRRGIRALRIGGVEACDSADPMEREPTTCRDLLVCLPAIDVLVADQPVEAPYVPYRIRRLPAATTPALLSLREGRAGSRRAASQARRVTLGRR